jgi:hypothetical protein
VFRIEAYKSFRYKFNLTVKLNMPVNNASHHTPTAVWENKHREKYSKAGKLFSF